MHTLYTLGYTSTTPEEMKKMAEELGAIIGDIRFSPRSRAKGWNMHQLSQTVGPARYRFLGMWFGNQNYNNGGPIKLAKPENGVDWIKTELDTNPVILICACFDHHTCHRLTVVEFLAEKLSGLKVQHLYGSRLKGGN